MHGGSSAAAQTSVLDARDEDRVVAALGELDSAAAQAYQSVAEDRQAVAAREELSSGELIDTLGPEARRELLVPGTEHVDPETRLRGEY
jgi:hypothetical protein